MAAIDLTAYTIDGVFWLGNLNQTASKPVVIRGADNLLYVCKARWLNPDEPHTPGNELLSAFLAHYLRLPIPAFKIVKYLGENYFGSQYQRTYPFNPAALPYPRIIASVFAFDVWVCNTDRHIGNFVAVEPMQGQTALMVIDHGRTLFGESKDESLWTTKLTWSDISPFVQAASDYQGCISTLEDFADILDRIEKFPEATLRSYADSIFYMAKGEGDRLFEDLCNRRSRVRELISGNKTLFGLS